MSEEVGVGAVVEPSSYLAGGRGLVVPDGVIDLIRTHWPLGPRMSLKEYRAALPQILEEERLRSERLDWSAHVPDEAQVVDRSESKTSSTAAPRRDDEPAPPTDVEMDEDDAQQRAAFMRWEGELLRESMRRAATSGKQWPSAAEYGACSDERLTEVLDRSLRDEAEWDDADRPDPHGIGDPVDPHPLQSVMRDVQRAQRRFREAEADRVSAGLNAWRAANEFALGTPEAAVNGPFHRAVMMELANDLQVAERTAITLVHAADDLESRLPRSWDRFLSGWVPWRAMQILHAEFDGLDEEFWDDFDERVAGALAKTPVPRLKQRLHEIREQIQVRTAVDRHKKALRRMHVGIEPAADGMAYLTALLPAAEAVSTDQRLDLAARSAATVDGEERGVGQLRAHILLDVIDEGLFRGACQHDEHTDGLAVPARRGVQCKVGMLIPAMTAMGHRDEPAILENHGPIDIETAKRLAAGATSWIKVLTDPITGAVVDIGRDKYRPTSDMRALLGLLDRGGRGPGSPTPPSRTEADHVVPFNQGLARGRTALDNLVLLARVHHLVKTAGLWHIELRADRALAWTSFMGTRIITEVEPLPPTPVPERFRAAAPPMSDAEWPGPGASDDLDCPF